MKRWIGAFVAGMMCLTLSAAQAQEGAGSEPTELKVGDKAPDFKLKGSDGKEYALSQFAGKQGVVIAWFPKAFTGGCTAECKSMRDNSEAIRAFDVAYFTASVDPPDRNKEFAESLEVDFVILSDPEMTTARAYGVVSARPLASRWTFYIDKDGIVRKIDKSINTATAGEDIVKNLTELNFPKKEK